METLNPANTEKIINRSFRWRAYTLPWFPRRGDRTSLPGLFKMIGLNEGVEVGTAYGAFAKLLCVANTGLHLTCVDPWVKYQDMSGHSQADHNEVYASAVKTLSEFDVTILRAASMDVVEKFQDDSLGFVYIDGDHRFDLVVQDIICWSRKVKAGGVVACHDFVMSGGSGVVLAVEAYTKAHNIKPWYITREYLSTAFWVKK